MPLPPLPAAARTPVDMSEPTRHELVVEARRTFGEGPARDLAAHLGVPFEDCSASTPGPQARRSGSNG